MLRPFKKFFLMLVCCLLASGCTSTGDKAEDHETIYSIDDKTLNENYSEMAREISGGSVQIYGLDDIAALDPAQDTIITPAPYEEGAVVSSVDSNVLVYPFSNESAFINPQSAPPPLMPPSEEFRPFQDTFALSPDMSPAVQQQILSAPQIVSYNEPLGNIERVYFKHGSSALNPDGKQAVERIGADNSGKFLVEGHSSQRAETADPVARRIVNLKMSMDRAFAVSSALIHKGVPVEMIETRAYGDARPVTPDSPEAENRRVDIRKE